MPKKRRRSYKGGDKITIQIPNNPEVSLLRLINTAEYVSPFLVEVLTEVAQKKYPNFRNANMDNLNEIKYLKE